MEISPQDIQLVFTNAVRFVSSLERQRINKAFHTETTITGTFSHKFYNMYTKFSQTATFCCNFGNCEEYNNNSPTSTFSQMSANCWLTVNRDITNIITDTLPTSALGMLP